jgi:hypothetical protein
MQGFLIAAISQVLTVVTLAADMSVFLVLLRRKVSGAGSLPFLPDLVRAVDFGSVALITATYLAIVAVGPRVFRWVFDHFTIRRTQKQTSRARRMARRISLLFVAIAGLVTLAAFLVEVRLGMMMAIVASAWVGGMLIALGLFHRRGVRLVCARCSYPMSTWRGAPDRCPECGTAWKQPWRARLGVRARQPRLVSLGAVLLAMSMTIAAAGSMYA